MASEIRFTIVRKMLENAGWTLKRVKGSHHQFTRPGQRTFVVAVHGGKVRPDYVRDIEKIIATQGKEEA